MKTHILTLAVAALCAGHAAALEVPDSLASSIPDRVVVLSGDASNAHQRVLAVLYEPSTDVRFHDPSAPRFLFLDRKGKIALGIGGYVYATVGYDFCGTSPAGSDFTPYAIPVPPDPAQRQALQFSANTSTVFLQLAGHSERFGAYSAFIQTDFTGDSYALKLKQAYFRIGYLTAGLTHTLFADGSTPGTVDTQGPCGVADRRNVLLSYTPRLSDRWSAGISAEAPAVGIAPSVSEDVAETVAQRVPDIPVFVQYGWGSDGGHVRAAALMRNMVYRDHVAARNRFVAGYGVQLSTLAPLGRTAVALYADVTYGRGIASYIADTKGRNCDLIPRMGEPGRLMAPRSFAYAVGLQYKPTGRLLLTALWSQNTMPDREGLQASGYRSGNYLSVNGFYEVFDNCTLGLAYDLGRREDFGGATGYANRVMLAAKYAF